MTDEQRAAQIVSDILQDLTDRRGMRQAWEAIDEPIRVEIVRTWEAMALHRLRPPPLYR